MLKEIECRIYGGGGFLLLRVGPLVGDLCTGLLGGGLFAALPGTTLLMGGGGFEAGRIKPGWLEGIGLDGSWEVGTVQLKRRLHSARLGYDLLTAHCCAAKPWSNCPFGHWKLKAVV